MIRTVTILLFLTGCATSRPPVFETCKVCEKFKARDTETSWTSAALMEAPRNED